MAERVFGDAAIPDAERQAMTLARHLHRTGWDRFNARDLRRTIGGVLRDVPKMRAACEALVEAGLIRPAFTRSGASAGRAAQNFEVHPVLLGRAP